jgi:hypothetical protein
MKKILTLPTWQVFILLVIPAIFPISYFGLVLIILWAGLFIYFIYFLGNSLYQKLPAGHDLKIKTFNYLLFFAIAYLAIVNVVFHGGYSITQNNYKDYGWSIAIIIPLHLFTMYCMFYVIWFIAKAIATIENHKVVGFDRYAGNFFLLVLFPIGIWWIHPKVRKIFSAERENLPSS